MTAAVPKSLPRDAATAYVQDCMGRLVAALPRPACLFATGGETLRALCAALGAQALSVEGEVCPGVPSSVLCGGRWDGVRVISKSGAFGAPHLLRTLMPRD